MPLDEERSVFMDNEIGVAVMAVSLDRNKQLSIRIDGEVKPSDDLLIKIFQRLHSTAPAFAAMMCQVCRWYVGGMPRILPRDAGLNKALRCRPAKSQNLEV